MNPTNFFHNFFFFPLPNFRAKDTHEPIVKSSNSYGANRLCFVVFTSSRGSKG